MSKRPFPLLSYHADWLIVDRAWVDARKQMALVKIKDRYFEIELDSARAGKLPWPRLDQCDLMPVDHGPTDTDWPLGREGGSLPFRFILRSSLTPKQRNISTFNARSLSGVVFLRCFFHLGPSFC